MKFATLFTLAATVSAQPPDCMSADDCPADSYGEEACCAQLSVGPFLEGNFGAFGQYIWKLPEGEELSEGWTTTFCVPKTYIDARAEAEAASDIAPFLTAYDNLALVLETVPGVREAF